MANFIALNPTEENPAPSGRLTLHLIQQAVLAERERCAKIALRFKPITGFPNATDRVAFVLCERIAAAIRRGPETGESTAPKTQPEANE